MAKMFLEVVTSKFRNGTSMRDKEKSLVELKIDHAIPELFPSVEELKEVESEILEILTKYAEKNDVVLGLEYNNAMVGTNMYQDQKYSKEVFIERGNGYFRRLLIQNEPYMKNDQITFNWFVGHREHWTMVDGSFRVHHREN